MSLIKIILIALGLAADALAVSVAEGIMIEKAVHRHTLRVSIMFGMFQGVMPVLGWLVGQSIRQMIGPWEHWVAFGLLVFVGGKMVVDALSGVETETREKGSRGLRLAALAVITSLDALAIGITIAVLGVNIWIPAAVIGLITAVLCAIGVQTGHRIGTHLGREAEVVGGLVLVGLGTKILLEYLLG